RELLWAGKQKEAEDLAMKEFMSDPIRQRAYQAFGDLQITIDGIKESAGYTRRLDLDTGIATTEFTSGGTKYRREVFASFPVNAIVVRITADKPVTMGASLTSAHGKTQPAPTGPAEIAMRGQPEDSAIRVEARLLALTEDGHAAARDGSIQ